MAATNLTQLMDSLKSGRFITSFQWTVVSALSLFIAWALAQAVCNLYFHPLAAFPGPFWGRVSLFWRFWHTMSGRSHRAIQRQHKKYGSVFRVSPNELSFASVESWKAIYGYPPPGQGHIVKSEFYDIYGAGFKTGCIGSERDPQKHALKKKNLSAAFSTQALSAQETLVQKCWDEFIEKIGPLSQVNPKGINIVKWFEMATFDILGEMAFGESFHCVEKEQHHFWLTLILEHLLEITLVDNLRRIPFLATLGRWILPSLTVQVREKHTGYSREKVEKRLNAENTRHDFLTNMVSKVKSGQVSREEMTAHASTLIIAGGETTAHTLSSIVFYVLKTPGCMEKLAGEIRSRYRSYEEIDATSALQLPYLQAVMNEALRIHPSGAQGFPRISPGVIIDGHYIPPGTEVYTSAWTVTHDPANFHQPDVFKPERWTDPTCTDITEASQPFSLGYRACLGRNFAFIEMALCLAKMAYKYDWELVDKDLDWEAASRCHIMWWKAPILVKLMDRADF
ncbi:cytochrome P450 monooxygenase [Xylariaceae sp. FL1651]|nr:cytochrome P450 monooxygenase [Xylariaceae sp. FL1651]